MRLEPDGLQVVLRAAAVLVALYQRVQLPEVLLHEYIRAFNEQCSAISEQSLFACSLINSQLIH